MTLTIVGYGNVGSGLAKQFVKAGHQVTLTGRSLDKAQAVAESLGAQALPIDQAAKNVEVLVLAVPYDQAPAALATLGDLKGKVIVDVSNPLTADYMGLTVGFSSSAAEEIAKLVPTAHVVKAFNTLFAQVMHEGAGFGDAKGSVFFAGDEAKAKDTVQALIESIDFDAVDAGGLKNARYLEPVAGLNIYFGYGAGLGTQIAPAWLKR
jgi:predicted dinucleotide-binding enzyme